MILKSLAMVKYLIFKKKLAQFIILKAFENGMKMKKGSKLWLQQIYGLVVKRFLIFKRRYILALITLLLPLVLQIIICSIIPSGTAITSSLSGSTYTSGTNNLKIINYQPFTLPYAISGNVSLTNFQNLLQIFYTTSKRPGITLERVSYDNISTYVFQMRKKSLTNLISNYYAGMSFNLIGSSVYATAYYSTFAYNSPGSILNEISNLILSYLNSNNLSQTITTYNTPIPSTSVSVLTTSSFIDYLPCIDSLPYSILNFSTSIIIGLIISILVIHVGRERVNGSKGLQMLSGTNFITYWFSNYIFDLIICFINICSLVSMLKLVNAIANNSSIEIYSVAIDPQIDYLFLVLIFSMFSWPFIAYIWTFLFKSEVIGSVVLAIVFGVGAFVDLIWSFVQLIVQTTATTNGTSTSSSLNSFLTAIRWIMAIIFPNVTIKRTIFDLKISNNSFCQSSLNTLLYSKTQLLI